MLSFAASLPLHVSAQEQGPLETQSGHLLAKAIMCHAVPDTVIPRKITLNLRNLENGDKTLVYYKL